MKARLAAVLAALAFLSLGGVSIAASSASHHSAGAGRAEAPGHEPAGLYSGGESQNGNGMDFYVSGSTTKVQDFVINLVGLSCPGGGGLSSSIVLSSMKIRRTRSFSLKTRQVGVEGAGNFPTTFTITLHGHFGKSSSGIPDASGTYVETAKYLANGTTTTCSSDPQTWSATRATQPKQPRGVGKPGTYSLTESQNGNGGSFHVSASRAEMQTLDITLVGLGCNPGDGGTSTSIVVSSLKLPPNGSFSTTYNETTGSGARLTITFRGHFHGVASTGASRAAGSYLVTGTYTANGTIYHCSSNQQSWYAARTGP